jgi:hypothetical protein
VLARLSDVLPHLGTEADAYALHLLTDEDTEAMTVALAEVVGHYGLRDTHTEVVDTLNMVDNVGSWANAIQLSLRSIVHEG